MRKSRFTENQIIAVIKAVETGRTIKDVCHETGISEATYYKWRAKYGNMDASDIKKVKALEEESRSLKQMLSDSVDIKKMQELENENNNLKRMFADLSLENRVLKDIIEKNI